ncbi:MAG TPA: hypothetical protein PL048_17685, partial [Leptospiraceae bacterium]|nr:hypothetical protein [Leptospiraceae bacterium]
MIHLEDNKTVSDDFYKFYKTAIENNCKIFYHEAVIEDLGKDSNQERRKIILAKLQKYSKLENSAVPDKTF